MQHLVQYNSENNNYSMHHTSNVKFLKCDSEISSHTFLSLSTPDYVYNIMFFYYLYDLKDLGINISGVNLDHLPAHIDRTTAGGLKENFIECSIDRSTRQTLFDRLKKEYGAVDAKTYEGK